MKIILTMFLLALPVSAYADWGNTGMQAVSTPNFSQPVQHQIHMNVTPTVRVEPPHRAAPSQPVVHNVQPVRHDQPVDHRPTVERHDNTMPVYFRHDARYYGYDRIDIPYADVDVPFTVPDGFEAIVVDGQAYYYNNGVFYQQVGDQLAVIPAVLGAVVDYIPNDYQIIMEDGVHYLFTGGVYYQRVDQGFEVVQPPTSYQE